MAEKQERRSIADAMNMSDEALAFIKGSPTKTTDVKRVSEKVPPVKDESATEIEPESPVPVRPTDQSAQESTRRRTYRSNDARTHELPRNDLGFGMNNLLVPLTTRLQPSTAAALKRAGLEQKLRGQSPATVQDIVEVSITTWLKAERYLR